MAPKKILIVEDEAIAAVSIKMSLADLGHETVGIAVTGEDAIEAAIQTMPDLILMDIILAGKMDGIEAAMQIRKQFEIPIVYITAHTDKGTVERAMNTNPAAFMEKPIEDYQLSEALDSLFYKT
jgi:CheY-like chemotaxis protein